MYKRSALRRESNLLCDFHLSCQHANGHTSRRHRTVSGSREVQCTYGPPIDHWGVSINLDIPKSSILIGVSLLNHPFWKGPMSGNPEKPLVQASTSTPNHHED